MRTRTKIIIAATVVASVALSAALNAQDDNTFPIPPEDGGGIVMEWDPNPASDNVTEYRVYVDQTDDGIDNFQLLKRVEISPDDPHETELTGWDMALPGRTYLTAFNGLESGPSEVISVQPPPANPGGYRIRVRVTVEVETP